MSDSTNQTIACRVPNALFREIRKRVRETDYPSTSAYVRDAIEAFIGNEPIPLTFADVKPGFEGIAEAINFLNEKINDIVPLINNIDERLKFLESLSDMRLGIQ